MSTTRNVQATLSTGTGRQVFEEVAIAFPDTGTGRSNGSIGVLSETVAVTAFADGGGAAGTYQMAGSLPAGCIVLRTKIGPVVGFAGDTSAALKVGDGSTADRYNTSTASVFATAAVGIDCGIVSGAALQLTAIRPTITVTTNANFTAALSDGSGIVTVSIYYIQTS